MIATQSLQTALAACPRVALGSFPTPLEEAPRLSRRLGIRLYIKRDDSTGLAMGGNKVRKLEFLMGTVRDDGYDSVVTTGGSQSNHARLTAAACAKLGIPCYLVLDRGLHPEQQGNLLLDHLFGAEVHLIQSQDRAVAVQEMEALADRLKAQGKNPYIITRGGSTPIGARGYVSCAAELASQLSTGGIAATQLHLATGSTGTHSGMLAGLTALNLPLRVQGVSVSRSEVEQIDGVLSLANRTLEALDLPARVDRDNIHVDDRFVGAGYGHPTSGMLEAIRIVAQEEALLLDPVYTGKAMAGLIAHVGEGRIDQGETVIFLHTGGAPALFAYHAEIGETLGVATPA